MEKLIDQHLALNSNAFFGCGRASQLGQLLSGYGFRSPAVIVDQAVSGHPSVSSLIESLATAGLNALKIYKADSRSEPTYSYLDTVAAEFRGSAEPDVLIGIGGGSALDLAKGVGVLLGNPGPGISYRGMNLVKRPGAAVVLLPTTAGSGSEVTHTASFVDTDSQTKLGINGRYVSGLFSVLDPLLPSTAPASVTVSSGLDALVHAIEGVTCRTANSFSRLFGREAVRLMFEGLPGAVADSSNLAAWSATVLGSHYAGLSMANAGGGPASGISYPLGVHYRVPHGLAGGLLLPHVVAFNVDHGYAEGYAAIFDAMAPEFHSRTAESKAREFSERLFSLCAAINAPARFDAPGLSRKSIAQLTALTIEQRKANLELNPVLFGENDVIALLENVLC